MLSSGRECLRPSGYRVIANQDSGIKMPIDPTGHFVTVGGKSYEITTRPEVSEFGGRFWWVFDGREFHRLRERCEGEAKPNGFAAIDREARQWLTQHQLRQQVRENAAGLN